uniref:Major sperm protein n=1 Tax=Steinernema glaseri TaxID=37863 RepID=A0A1I7YR85_9BILA
MPLRKMLFLLPLVCIVHAQDVRSMMKDCVKPWQQVLLTVETISKPSTAVECHPDTNPCPGEAECHFSFKSFKYVCCQDRHDIRPPVCPKYHDTLRTLCARDNKGSCPSGYSCMSSRFDNQVNICCRPNLGLKYPEPETAGQIIPQAKLNVLNEPPCIRTRNISRNGLYTIMMFDKSADRPVSIYWMARDIQLEEGASSTFCGGQRFERSIVQYHPPKEDVNPQGVHVMAVVMFEQTEMFNPRKWPRVSQEDFNVKRWLSEADGLVKPIPITGNFFGFRSRALIMKS